MHWSEQLSQPTHRLQWYHNWVFHHPEVPREVLQLCDSWPLPPCRNSGGIQPAGIVLSVFWNTDSFSVDRKNDEWGRWYPASRNRIVSNRCEGQSVVNDMHVISVPEPVWIRLLSSLWEKCDLCRSYYCSVSAWARAKETGWYWHSVYCVRCRLIPDNQLVSNSLDFLLFKNLLAPPHFPAFRSAHCSLCSALNDDNTDVKKEPSLKWCGFVIKCIGRLRLALSCSETSMDSVCVWPCNFSTVVHVLAGLCVPGGLGSVVTGLCCVPGVFLPGSWWRSSGQQHY